MSDDEAAALAIVGFRPDLIADLTKLGLSEESKARRRKFIGGSDATIIASGDGHALNKLALQKRGMVPDDDLSDVLQPMLGLWTEPFNLAWAERVLGGTITRRGEVMIDPDCPWRSCTLDGWFDGAPVQAKHVAAWAKTEEVVAKYTAQLHHEMMASAADKAHLSVIFGNNKFELVTVDFDPLFAGQLAEAEENFWTAVQEGRDPVPSLVKGPPVNISELIEVDLTSSNSYANFASMWLATKDIANAHKKHTEELKSFCGPEARRVYGHGVEVTKAKNGALTVREMKDKK